MEIWEALPCDGGFERLGNDAAWREHFPVVRHAQEAVAPLTGSALPLRSFGSFGSAFIVLTTVSADDIQSAGERGIHRAIGRFERQHQHGMRAVAGAIHPRFG